MAQAAVKTHYAVHLSAVVCTCNRGNHLHSNVLLALLHLAAVACTCDKRHPSSNVPLALLHLTAVVCMCNRQQIADNSTRDFTAYGGQYAQSMNPDDHGTSHLSVVDSQRGAVAMTTTINTGFGSKVISNSTGLLLSALYSSTCTLSV